ncbi:MAG TPA: hypothetical protein VHM02_00250 [Thermoanaerobaculia bacterium]|nr:hypothetical protein [Thermoanaerobaculia bacterium]
MNELDPIPRPDLVDEATWEALTPGERVRALKSAEEGLPLPAHVYGDLRELPAWAFYGPETGLPEDWFNLQGFLLPRFRPGGGDRPRFLAWKREIRLRRRILADLEARSLRWRDAESWFLLVLVGIAVVIGSAAGRSRSWWLPQAITVAVSLALGLAAHLLLPLAVRAGVAWVLWRRTGRRTAQRLGGRVERTAPLRR